MPGTERIKKFISDSREAVVRNAIRVFHPRLSSDEKKYASEPLYATCIREHEEELADWKDPYGYWLRNDPWETRARSLSDDEGSVGVGEYSYVFLCTERVIPAKGWKTAVREALRELEDINGPKDLKESLPLIIYGDEDEADGKKPDGTADNRRTPYFKPDYSPELLERFNFLGEFILVRKDVLEKAGFDAGRYECEAPDPVEMVKIVMSVSELLPAARFSGEEIRAHMYKGVLHVPHILSHRIKGHVRELYSEETGNTKTERTKTGNNRNLENSIEGELPRISVIIPSKDHPEVLKTCLSSLLEKTEYHDRDKLEIIVVDNGSSPDKKAGYEQLSETYGFTYIYDPQPFNYSRMNNIGIDRASGDIILLLNDDTEIISGDWLMKMAGYAVRPEVGAVGAKLLYAGTDLIQHAGVTLLAVGPSHKILALPDGDDHYFGRNLLDHDMLAVTGACLMVSADKLRKVSGLNEELKVAYNDIDLCLKLYENGYRSVQCNGAVLYHYESLTRGQDTGDGEKYTRLLAEKEKLYSYHPWTKGFDPFYNPNLIDNSADYLPATKDCTRNTEKFSECLGKPETLPGGSFMIRARLDRVQKQLRNTEDGEDFVWMDGWAFVRGCDNRRFGKSLVLSRTDGGGKKEYELFSTYRKDLPGAFKGEKHLELSGFYFRIPVSEFEGCGWRAGIMMTDCITGKKLYRNLKYIVSPD